MKTLVTGGAGFIGSHFCEFLLNQGHSVAVVDDLNDFYSPTMKRDNLSRVRRAGSIDFQELDICDAPQLTRVLGVVRPEAVVHFAARPGVGPSLRDPLSYARVNVCGTVSLLDACIKAGVRRFVFLSSSSVYGMTERVPFSEDDHLNLPMSPYAATKIAGEKLCYSYSHVYGLQVACLRLFSVYGPRQRPDLAIRKFTAMIDGGQEITVFGDGSARRDYTFIDDAVRGIYAAMRYSAPFEIFNIGNACPISLNDVFRALECVLGKKAVVRWEPPRPEDMPITHADISKAQRALGYHPTTSFSDGVQQFAQWYRAVGHHQSDLLAGH